MLLQHLFNQFACWNSTDRKEYIYHATLFHRATTCGLRSCCLFLTVLDLPNQRSHLDARACPHVEYDPGVESASQDGLPASIFKRESRDCLPIVQGRWKSRRTYESSDIGRGLG